MYELVHGYTPYFFDDIEIERILEIIDTHEITYKYDIDIEMKHLLIKIL
jgi:hypothetical protein